MRNNKREVILDFTSLLDVIMLILFFFVIFAQIDSSNAVEIANNDAQHAIQYANQIMQEANDSQANADAMMADAEVMVSDAEQMQDYAKAVVFNSSSDFDKAIQLQLDLKLENEKWKIDITESGKKEILDTIENVRERKPEELAEDFDKFISSYSYSTSDAILINLVYGSDIAGSRKSKEHSDEMIRLLRDKYNYQYLFSTTVDISAKEVKHSEGG